MPYSTTADVQQAVGGAKRLIDLTDWTNTGAIDAAVVALAIAEADAFIDSFSNKRWAPGTTPLVITKLSAKIAARVLRRDREMVTEADVEAEKLDLAWLKMLSDGTVTLPSGTQVSTLEVDKTKERDSTKNVSRERLKGFW